METVDLNDESVIGEEETDKQQDSSPVTSEEESSETEEKSQQEEKSESEEDSSEEESKPSTRRESKDIRYKSSPPKEKDSTKSYKVIFNVADAKYPIIRHVGKKIFGWRLTSNPSSDWDICWIDKTVPTETLAKMRPYQKINHFPGILSIARKNHLGKNLMKMRKILPENYDFFPKTYLLPTDYQEFKSQFIKSKKPKTFIVKPEGGAQGKGIFLTKTYESVHPKDRYVAQKYLKKPYLIDGLKFDMRLYVLLAGCDPLRIYLYNDGLGRFATEKYCAPNDDNMEDTCMHLTNYAINKENPNFVFNNSSAADDVGHKKSLKAVFKILEEKGHDVKSLWEKIKKIIIKTFCSVQPILAHNYKSCHPNDPYNNMCFEVLGFDIMIDSKLKPWLIEVNHLPSFTTDTPLDKTMKRNVIRDALQIMNISGKDKEEYKNKKKIELHQRAFSSKRIRMTPEERQVEKDAAQSERDEWESKNQGDFEKIYPLTEKTEDSEDYEEFIKLAHQNWQTWTGTEVRRDISRPPIKREVSQDTSINETENPSTKSLETTPYKKSSFSLASPKIMTKYSEKRTPSAKGLLNDSNSISASSHKTATSTLNKIDEAHMEFQREQALGPWCSEKITEYSDGSSFDHEAMSRIQNFNTIEENDNDEEDILFASMESPKSLAKKSFAFYKSATLDVKNMTIPQAESSGTQRANRLRTSGINKDNYATSVSARAGSQIRNSSKSQVNYRHPFLPKKSLSNIAQYKDQKESEKEQRRKTPSANQSRISGGDPNLSKSMIRSHNNASALEKKTMSPAKKITKINTKTIPTEPITPRNSSPTKPRVPTKSETKSAYPIRSTSTKILSNTNAETREKSVGKKSTVKKKKKKVSEEEADDKKPKKIILKLGKETIPHSASNLEHDIKKVWPSNPSGLLSVYEGKMKEKSQMLLNQPSVYSQSPHYYQVKLSKDASPQKLYEHKPDTAKKDKKGTKKKKTLMIQEVEVIPNKPTASSKTTTKSKAAPHSPKGVTHNNFFK